MSALTVPVPPAPPAHPGGPRYRTSLANRRRLLIAVLIVVGAVGYLLYQGLDNATMYFRTADQAVADKTALGTRRFRIEGTVDPGLHTQGIACVAQHGGGVHFSSPVCPSRFQLASSW